MGFVCPRIYHGISFGIYLEICHVGKFIKKGHGLLESNSSPPHGGEIDENSRRP